jgi:hypothetical protein
LSAGAPCRATWPGRDALPKPAVQQALLSAEPTREVVHSRAVTFVTREANKVLLLMTGTVGLCIICPTWYSQDLRKVSERTSGRRSETCWPVGEMTEAEATGGSLLGRMLGPYGVLRGNRTVSVLFGGQVVSPFGDWLYVLAFDLTGAATIIAVITFVRLLSFVLLLPFSGILAGTQHRQDHLGPTEQREVDLDRYFEEDVNGFAGLIGAHDARPGGEGTLVEQGASRSSSSGSRPRVVGTLAALLGHAGGSGTIASLQIPTK